MPRPLSIALTRFLSHPMSLQDCFKNFIPCPSQRQRILFELCRSSIRRAPASAVVVQIAKAQPRIQQVWDAWKNLPSTLFGDENDRAEFERSAIDSGIFAKLAQSDNSERVNEIIVEAYRVLSKLKNSRSVVATWTKALGISPVLQSRFHSLADRDYEERYSPIRNSADWPYEAYSNVMRQQSAIEKLLEKGDETKARQYVRDLIDKQVAQGGAAFAAKSLCRLAQKAKTKGLRSTSVEWLEQAVQIAPADAWTHGQLADAYIYYGRLQEAQKELGLAETYGDRFFAVTARARIFKSRAQFEEALETIRTARDEAAGHEDAYVTWVIQAEILRDMWRLEEALAVYQEAAFLFHNERVVHCGLAAVFVELGRYTDAIRVYDACLDVLGEDVVTRAGRAQALLEMGLGSEALDEYQRTKIAFPEEPIPHCGLAEALRIQERYEEAMESYAEARSHFPYIAAPFAGHAETLKDVGRYEEALSEYNAAIERFPYEARLFNGRASALRLMGKFTEALSAYDEAVARFPFDLYSAMGRAVLLKELGRLEDAKSVYDQIMARKPSSLFALHGKASILVFQKKYSEALLLLAEGISQTPNDWVGLHIKGMIFLRTDRIAEAIELFRHGVSSAPYGQKRYFRSALAVATLRLGQYDQAREQAEAASFGPTGKVLMFHALAAQKRRPDALSVYGQLSNTELPKHITNLRDEIAARFRIVDGLTQYDEDWVFERECEAALLAA